MLMKRNKAGSHKSSALWHASTQDWASSEATRRSALSGGHDGKSLALEAQARRLEFGWGMKGPEGLADHNPDEFKGGKGASGEQKSCTAQAEKDPN